MAHLRVTIGHLRVTIGHLRATMGHLRLTIGHLRVTIGLCSISKHKANTTELHPKVRQTCCRFANIFLQTNFTVIQMWEHVTKIKSNISLDLACRQDGLYSDGGEPHQDISDVAVKKLQEKLNINSSEVRFQNMTLGEIKSVAEMFLYLNLCPGPLQAEFKFIDDLFKKKTPYTIILTLNRLNKGINNQQTVFFKIIAEKIMNRILQMLSPKYKDIISMLPGLLNDVSSNADHSCFNSFSKESK